ncbi:hypothetical protein A2U01_0109895, partial [Trifolium medium]|nr:hypothetical protein [Trifolium medium]
MGEIYLAGRETRRSFLAPARKFQDVAKTHSLGEGLLAGRAGADLSPIYRA